MKLKSLHTTILLNLILAVFLFLNACESNTEKKVVIACAANVQFAMDELTQEFERETGIQSSIVVASSGKLTAQIREGAPFDVFVSADMKFPEEVYNSGKGIEPPKIYAYGELVLLSLDSNIKAELASLTNPNVKHISVANPKTAPYGRAAEEVLIRYGLLEKIKSKLVFGESVSQTNQFISTGAAELGFTSKSSIKAFHNPNAGYFSAFEEGSYNAIEQGVILIKNPERNLEDAKKFYLFLFSEKSREILINNGYHLPAKKVQ
jgi:molybdate transport system substrate-binding protein